MTEKATTKDPLKLAAKLAAVAGEMNKVPKNGYNADGKYKYAMATDVFDGVRKNLAEQKVALTFTIDDNKSTIEKREKGVLATLWIDYQFVDGESDERLTVRTMSTAADYGMSDKAVYKAQTNALKYLMFQVFQISTGDDDVEKDTSEPKEDKPTARRAAPKPADKTAPKSNKGEMTDEQRADIVFLNAQLGEKKRTNKQLKETLEAHGAKALIEILAGDHKTEHGVDCTHYADGSEGAIVVKRG